MKVISKFRVETGETLEAEITDISFHFKCIDKIKWFERHKES